MTKLTFEISMSLDQYVAGPNRTVEQPLGEGGERLHEWVVALASGRRRHGLSGGTEGADSAMLDESVEANGAIVMGRRMFSGGEGPWEDDPVAGGWWGDDPPFGVPVFVLTHHPRETLTKGATSFTFVTDGIEAALTRAREAAGDRNVAVAGGASVIQQYLKAGLVDELQLHVVPILLGDGVRLFEGLGPQQVQLEATSVIPSEGVTHLRYRVVR